MNQENSDKLFYGLGKSELEGMQQVFTRHPEIDEVFLYGSRAKGTFKRGSDIDLAVKGKNLSIAVVNSLATELDDLNLPYEFDLTIYDRIENRALIKHIDRVGKRIYVQ